MHPDQRQSLFDSTRGSSSPPGAAGSSTDDAATQPMADLPLFAPVDGRGAQSSPAAGREAEEQHGTRPVAPRSSSAPGDERSASVPVRQRLLASALDAAALLLTLGLLLAISLVMGVAVKWGDLPLYLPTWLAFGFFYQVMPLLFWGRTPGMQVAGIESRDADGQPLSLQQAALRWLAALVTWLLLGLPGLLALTGRSLTDRMSGSRTFASS